MKCVLCVLAIGVGLIQGGCASRFHQRTAKMDLAEYATFLKGGTGVIEGQAFLRTAGGEVKTAAGLSVWANPVTTYSTEWYQYGVLGGKELSDTDPATPKGKSTTADAQGNFTITGLAPGDYYVVSHITWLVGPTTMSGGYACAEATVQNGKVTKVLVTR